jgi:hypothetical protein
LQSGLRAKGVLTMGQLIDANGTQASFDWSQINWRKVEKTVLGLQQRIFMAKVKGDVKGMESLQRLLASSRAAKLLAIRKVGQESSGRRTPGVDGVVSISDGESREHWAERRRLFPIGPHAELLTRPFLTRPSPRQWTDLIDHALRLRAKKRLDLFVVDPLASFLPGQSESDPGTLLTMLQPLQMLASRGVAVLILHHPRKEASEEGSTARGSGALLGYVDIILELHRFGRLATDECRRKIVGLSRHKATPRRLAYQWAPDTGAFERLDDLDSLRYRENWDQVRMPLKQRKQPATRRDLLDEWPDEQNKPSGRTLYDWLTRAVACKKAVCCGSGTRTDPFRYRLRNEDDDYYDRGELPPLRPLR